MEKLKSEINLKPVDAKKKFFTRLNQRTVKCSKGTIKFAGKAIEAILYQNKNSLIELCEKGIPDDLPILRAYLWKILLNYLPLDSDKWEETLKKKRNEYEGLKKFSKAKLEKEIKEKKYKSKETLEQILKDVYRTDIHLSFFFQPTDKKKVFNSNELIKIFDKRKNCTFQNVNEIYFEDKENETHTEVLKRILFIHTILVPELSYHQGMNELLAPIFFCYSYDKLYVDETEEEIEADSFWSFHYLMSKVSKSFESAKDQGLDIKSEIFSKCLKFVDEDVYNHLLSQNVRNEYFCYKWFILLFSQEFELEDILKLWDLVFTNDFPYYYIYYISIALIEMKRDTIINGGMVEIMQALQTFEDINVSALIKKTKEIKKNNSESLDVVILWDKNKK